MKKLILGSVLALTAFATQAGQIADYSIYGGVGTEGMTVGVGKIINSSFGVRGEFNGFNYSHSFTSGSNTYNANLSLKSFDAYLDYFPFENAFRLTAGLSFNNDSLTGNANASNVTINGVSYAVAAGQSVNAKVKFATIAPYLGLGLGHSPRASGFGAYADLGVMYANPTATLNVTQGLASTVGVANIAAEQNVLQGYANKFQLYPVAKVGITYAF